MNRYNQKNSKWIQIAIQEREGVQEKIKDIMNTSKENERERKVKRKKREKLVKKRK